ncbi:carbohydrate kinase [Pontibacter sp. E15-1]|uniref:carbohydrate kinase family protein n=1 Tax=Pontibacter sp. E15-1 TaxID=2919918 RepID=UPI001F4F8312|nr:carbohydrate kinase [Pontibacter sp. E15-1]MCJ8163424.1 carbohydrate kinase [Pontibacter sp. E15-1]
MDHKIVCFGEMLWDMLPSGELPGGAPMNVAIHMRYQGLEPVVVSRVGDDALGENLLAYLTQKGVQNQWVQVNEGHKTGVVLVNVSNRSEVSYDIVQPVAWDFIQLQDGLREHVAQSDFFIYGSLAARSKTSRDTLHELLKIARLKVFDVNLRPPYYSREVLEPLLQHANIVKMNHHELMEITEWHHPFTDEQGCMAFVRAHYGVQTIIVTRGENGAAVLCDEGYFEQDGFHVEVENTIGSGDAFLATFLANHIKGKSYLEALRQACAVGALVATQRGATPEIAPEAVAHLLQG